MPKKGVFHVSNLANIGTNSLSSSFYQVRVEKVIDCFVIVCHMVPAGSALRAQAKLFQVILKIPNSVSGGNV